MIELMKFDMGGSAATLGCAKVIEDAQMKREGGRGGRTGTRTAKDETETSSRLWG